MSNSACFLWKEWCPCEEFNYVHTEPFEEVLQLSCVVPAASSSCFQFGADCLLVLLGLKSYNVDCNDQGWFCSFELNWNKNQFFVPPHLNEYISGTQELSNVLFWGKKQSMQKKWNVTLPVLQIDIKVLQTKNFFATVVWKFVIILNYLFKEYYNLQRGFLLSYNSSNTLFQIFRYSRCSFRWQLCFWRHSVLICCLRVIMLSAYSTLQASPSFTASAAANSSFYD